MESDNTIAHLDVGQRTRQINNAASYINEALEMLGLLDPVDGRIETAVRIARFWGSYEEVPVTQNDVASVVSPIFAAESFKEMVVTSRIRFDALCEHHFLPFTGYAAIGIIPKGKVYGLSKTARLMELFCKRPTMQERLTSEIADALFDLLQPKGLGVVLYETMHSCMSLRGVRSHEATTTTSALRGVMMNEPETRAEFLTLAGLR